MVEDLVAAAINDARAKADAAAAAEMQKMTERAAAAAGVQAALLSRLPTAVLRHDALRRGEAPMTLGAMQDFPLRIMRLIDHAEREHGNREIVAARADGIESSAPTGSASRMMRGAWRRRSSGSEFSPGDRVATLAMNHDRHSTAWFGVVGMGGVLHTLNPRLFDDQLEYIVNHAEDRVLLYDAAFAPLVERMKPRWTTVEHYVCFDERVRRLARRPRTATIAGTKATSATRAASATPAARPATPRACSTSIARPCFTRCRSSRPTFSTCRRAR